MSEALVTGASSGLGRVLSVRLAAQGRKVLLLARDEGRLAQTALEVEAAGGSAEVLSVDVADHEAVERALAGRELDLVLHAAGVLSLGAAGELGAPDLRRMLEGNVLGAMNVVAATLPALSERRGRIGMVSSIVAVLAVPGGFSAYAASKWALRGWCETARPELRARGVSLTIAYPATIDTPMVAGLAESGPAVYRAFAWHAPELVADRLLRDVAARRSESWAGLVDRSAALGYRLAPETFGSLFRLVTRLRGGRR